jgi:hypothetical protein
MEVHSESLWILVLLGLVLVSLLVYLIPRSPNETDPFGDSAVTDFSDSGEDCDV